MGNETKIFAGLGVLTLIAIIAGALLFSKEPQPQVIEQSTLVTDYSAKRGPKDAKVTIVEFSDYQCPACQSAYPHVEKFLSEYQDKVQFLYRNFPLPIPAHKHAKIAAYTAEAAGKQEKYWQMHSKLFENQTEWGNSDNPYDFFLAYAKELELNEEQFKKDYESSEVRDIIEKDLAEVARLGLDSTPTFFINGTKYSEVLTYTRLKQIIDPLLSQ